MARLVAGFGTSHTPMLNAPVEDWPRFIERDRIRPHLDKAGRPITYEALERQADPGIAEQLRPAVFAERHRLASAQLDRLSAALKDARLDTLVVIGDDQKELYHDDNMPSILLFRGRTIRNVPLRDHPGPDWAARASARYYEATAPREYPVDTGLVEHLIASLIEAEFDVACADSLPEGLGEGHAFGFVHHRLAAGLDLPVVPVFLNTYFPPNQPTPRRCYRLGQAIRAAIERYPGDARIGIAASGGLSHFTVDEELDGTVIRALRERDADALAALPREKLNSGSSEIRNWICLAGAVETLSLEQIDYYPAYRTPAGTGTGLCFANWR
ncbi:MAG: protocatechuate 3,4-dioxygenase [Lautropia sp.]